MHRSRYSIMRFLPLFILVICFVWIANILKREAQFRESERLLNETVAELDRADPGWRWADLVARQSDLPDGENLVVQLRAVRALMIDRLGWNLSKDEPLFNEAAVMPNQLHDADDIAALERHQTQFVAATALAAKLENYPKAFALNPTGKNPLVGPLPFMEEARGTVFLLKLEVERLALANRPNGAAPLFRSMLAVAGALGEESFLVGNLDRNRYWTMTARSIERLLGLTEPHEELRTLLEPLRRAARGDSFYRSVRGERALMDGTFRHLEESPEGLMGMFDEMGLKGHRDRIPQVVLREYESLMKAEHALEVRRWTAILGICDLPLHERRAKIREIELNWPELPLTRERLEDMGSGCGLRMARGKETKHEFIVWMELRSIAYLECARIAIACELFRARAKRWPKTLDEIPKDILPETPLDPFDGQPLRYRVLDDSIAVWSVGEQAVEEPPELSGGETVRVSMVFRVWNPNKRRMPAPPPKPELLHEPVELPDAEADTKEKE
jgi:hypothetical protein